MPDDMENVWTASVSGRKFFYNDPDASDFHLEDIAHGLAMICRSGGSTLWHYSVGQHSNLIAEALWRDTGDAFLCLDALFHDAPEYVLCDIKRPMKQHMPGYVIKEAQVDRAIRSQMILKGIPVPPEMAARTKFYDNRIWEDELLQVMHPSVREHSSNGMQPLGVTIHRLHPGDAASLWLKAVETYTDIAKGNF